MGLAKFAQLAKTLTLLLQIRYSLNNAAVYTRAIIAG
jgi:hypothetical protein